MDNNRMKHGNSNFHKRRPVYGHGVRRTTVPKRVKVVTVRRKETMYDTDNSLRRPVIVVPENIAKEIFSKPVNQEAIDRFRRHSAMLKKKPRKE